MEKFNRLAQEKSPYLLQHKDNPVNWFAWGEEAFQIAHQQNKPIFLSIGYSTCYWCHVMEKDSFERAEVAEVLNQYFVSIKVDREEHPDLDQIYMDAVVAMSRQGGWPMTVFLTPDRKPFFGGTFFYRDQFLRLLEQIHTRWHSDYIAISEAATEFIAMFSRDEHPLPPQTLDETTLKKAFLELQSRYDQTFGGFGNPPKFPHSEAASLLFRISHRSGSKEALLMAADTLEAMARGGIYDHLGGGFHRYSTDGEWLVPHFEKMLYDNALLTKVYLEGFQITGKEIFREVAIETLDYVLREMTGEDGGFYSAQDAGEVGKEGEFYVWGYDELKVLMSDKELALLEQVYGMSRSGNFEHQTNILHLQKDFDWSIKKDAAIRAIHQKLLQSRTRRAAPHLDDKLLTAWNGLMISAFACAARVLDAPRYLEAATRCATFIKTHLYREQKLLRRYRAGDSKFPGCLEDYAYLIDGLIELYQSNFDSHWLHWATELQKTQDAYFWDKENGGYFFSEEGLTSLILRKKEYHDGAIPSPNGVSLLNLARLYHLTFDRSYQDRATKLLAAMSGAIERFPSAFCSSLVALDFLLDSTKEVVVVGPADSKEAESFKKFLFHSFLPNKVVSSGSPAAVEDMSALPPFHGRTVLNGMTTFYICEGNTCKAPTTDIEEAKMLVSAKREYSLE